MSGYSVVSYNLIINQHIPHDIPTQEERQKVASPSSLNTALWNAKDLDCGADTLHTLRMLYYLYSCTAVLLLYIGALSCHLGTLMLVQFTGPDLFSVFIQARELRWLQRQCCWLMWKERRLMSVGSCTSWFAEIEQQTESFTRKTPRKHHTRVFDLYPVVPPINPEQTGAGNM